jgi:hydroxypyruvate isomerase
MQRMEGELAKTIERLIAQIAHIQIAGNPNRTEPDRGEINYAFLFELIDRVGYQGWIGAEYKPVTTTVEGLGWFRCT